MGRNTGRDDFDLTRLPTEQEVADFDPYLGDECCTLQNFKVDLRKNPRSEYNQSVVGTRPLPALANPLQIM